MRLSELLDLPVQDVDGRKLGTIIDIRLSVAGDLTDTPALPAVFGIVVSPHTSSSYLGYERSEVRNPKPLAAMLRWRHRDTFVALWRDVAELRRAAGRDVAELRRAAVILRAGYTRYSPVLKAL